MTNSANKKRVELLVERTQITVKRRKIHLGSFSEISDAVEAYQDAARRFFGSYAR